MRIIIEIYGCEGCMFAYENSNGLNMCGYDHCGKYLGMHLPAHVPDECPAREYEISRNSRIFYTNPNLRD